LIASVYWAFSALFRSLSRLAKRDNTAEYIENWDPKQRRNAFP